MFTIFKKQNKDQIFPLNCSNNIITSDNNISKTKDRASKSKKRSNSFANQKFNKNLISITNQQPKKSSSQSRCYNQKLQSQLDQSQGIHAQKETQTIIKLYSKFKKQLRQIKENQSERIRINHFFEIFYKMKNHLRDQQRILTEQILLSIWKAIGGIQERSVDETVVFLTILYTQNLLQHYKEVSEVEKQRLIQSINMAEQKFKKYQKQTALTNNKNKINSDKHKPQDSVKKKNQKEPLKKKQNGTLESKSKDKLNTSKLNQQPKSTIEKPKLHTAKYFSQQNPCLQVTIKLREGFFEKLMIYPNTSIDVLSRTFGNKHSIYDYKSELSNQKIKMIKAMIKSQLKKQLTQITQESVDNMSQISDLFNQLD